MSALTLPPLHIAVVEEGANQTSATQIKTVLEGEGIYRVELAERVSSFSKQRGLRLLIAVLPANQGSAELLIKDLSEFEEQVSVLLVVGSDYLASRLLNDFMRTHDFLVLPLRDQEVRLRVKRLACRRVDVEAVAQDVGFAQFLGEDQHILALKRKMLLAARSQATVLLTGETGTGKERCARAMHYLSSRKSKPFLPVNCGAIPVDLFESEFYGHTKGAFTGASLAQIGLIAEAEGGTLFLDEIESLGMASQVKLLRFLQDQTFFQIGSSKLKQADVWIIAATNVNLPQRICDNAFRKDLFYRLAVVSLNLPPLRERPIDIPLLAGHFWKMYSGRSQHIRREDLSAGVIDALCQYSWPGNIRELENVIHQLAVLHESDVIGPEDLPIVRTPSTPPSLGRSFAQQKTAAIELFEKKYVAELLKTHRGNVTHAAKEAQKDRRAFGRLIKKYQISKLS